MINNSKALINQYCSWVKKGNYHDLSKLYKLPSVLYNNDHQCTCLSKRKQVSNYLLNKFHHMSSADNLHVELQGIIGKNLFIWKEVVISKRGLLITENILLVKGNNSKYWIIGEKNA